MTHLQQSFKHTAASIIKNLEARNMNGYYCETTDALVEKVLSMLNEGSTITWGGSITLKDSGLLDAVSQKNFELLDRSDAKSEEEKRLFFSKAVLSDYFFTSTNAITLDGELVNIDGAANRVACLCHGPKEVFVIAGMNKIVTDIGSGLSRTQNVAAPPNGVRLNRNTPCAVTGRCGDCMSPDCMCNQIVITRRSGIAGRIKVFLVGENLGY